MTVFNHLEVRRDRYYLVVTILQDFFSTFKLIIDYAYLFSVNDDDDYSILFHGSPKHKETEFL